jgi:hypothetical protein
MSEPNPAPAPQPAPQGDSVENLKTQVAQLQGQLQELQPFIEDASLLITGIFNNPQLKQQVVATLQGGTPQPQPQPQPQPTPQPQQQQPQPQPMPQLQPLQNKVDDNDVYNRDQIVKQVELNLGLTNLNQDQKKELRRSVEQRLNQWGTSVMTAPVNQLTSLLKDAYVLNQIPQAKEAGKVEGLVDAYVNNQAAFPAMNNANNPNEEVVMTPHHQQWAGKLGVAQDKVAANLKEFQETGRITYKQPENKAAPTPANPVPSGSPVPPAAPAAQPQPAPQQ